MAGGRLADGRPHPRDWRAARRRQHGRPRGVGASAALDSTNRPLVEPVGGSGFNTPASARGPVRDHQRIRRRRVDGLARHPRRQPADELGAAGHRRVARHVRPVRHGHDARRVTVTPVLSASAHDRVSGDVEAWLTGGVEVVNLDGPIPDLSDVDFLRPDNPNPDDATPISLWARPAPPRTFLADPAARIAPPVRSFVVSSAK